MRFANLTRRAVFGLLTAILTIAFGPMAAVAQNGSPRSAPVGYPMATPPPERESLFGGGGVNWPSFPFSRKKSDAPEAHSPRPAVGRSAPANRPNGQRFESGQARIANGQRVPANHRSGISTNGLAHPSMSEAQHLPNHPQYVTPPSLPTQSSKRPTANTTPPSPMKTADSAPKPMQAAEMLAVAHQHSLRAKSESEYTQIITACRKARSAQTDDTVTEYANNLESWALNRRGQLKAEAMQEQQALADFDAAIAADADCWRAIHNRGILLAQNGAFEKAFDDFSRTIELNPNFAKAFANRAALFIVAGNTEAAIEDYNHAIALDSQLGVAHRGLGRACHLDGQLDVALEHYDEAVRLSPNDSYAIASRADVLTDLGNYGEAAQGYEHALRVEPMSSHANSGSAWLLATCPDDSIRNSKLALERSQKAVSLAGGEDAATYDTLAAAQANDGNFQAAIQAVQQAVQLATPAERDAYNDRLTLYQSGKPYRLEPVEVIIQASHQE